MSSPFSAGEREALSTLKDHPTGHQSQISNPRLEIGLLVDTYVCGKGRSYATSLGHRSFPDGMALLFYVAGTVEVRIRAHQRIPCVPEVPEGAAR